MMNPKLSFYTNIPTPYQDDFFTALSAYFQLTVVYYAVSERNRQWAVDHQRKPYAVVYLRDSHLAHFVQRWVKDYHFSWSIFRTVRRDSSEYVIVSGSYWMPNAVFTMLLARWQHRQVAFLGERLAGQSTGWKAGLKRMLLWPLRYACTRVFAIGHEAAHTYEAFGVKLPKTIVPYTINISRFYRNSTAGHRSEPRFVLLSAGSLIHRKGMDTLIRALNQLDRTAYSHVRLRIAGDGPERVALRQLAGDDDRIEWLGFKDADELPGCFADADAFVFASRYDGWGVVINEAIAAGLPIVSSDAVGATREWIQDGVNGFVCAVDDADAFSRSIRRLVDDRVLWEQQADFNRTFRHQTSSAHYAGVMYRTILNDLSV